MRSLCSPPLGSFIQTKAASVLLSLGLALLALCVAIKSAKLDAELASWIQRTPRIESELEAISTALGDLSGSNSLLLLQSLKKPEADILTVDALMIHLEAMAIATHVTVDLFDVPWTLKDICFAPTLPDFDGLHVSLMLDNLMPCAIKTPLDCFWEGSKLLGSEQPVTFGSMGPKLKWSTLNPLAMVKTLQRNYLHASFSYSTLLDWMNRVGITSGYQLKPCLDPTDPNCPVDAPNKITSDPPDVGLSLTGGCRGLAWKLMHWQEDELLGGVTRNRSGHITRAEALQSTIQLMGEQEMYDYWRKTSKVQDVNNWSPDKAKIILETWQRRFKEELAQFSRTSVASNPYKLYAMTTNSMTDPIDFKYLLELTNVELCFIFMTLFTCYAYPNFDSNAHNEGPINRFKVILLAVISSSIIGLTFIASLGLSSFMNLPFNMSTTQILPPLALYYGFKQVITIANIYSQKFMNVPREDLTTECLNELIPIVTIDCIACVIPLSVATFIPVQATQAFASQAITFVLLSTFIAITFLPAMFTTFILYHIGEPELPSPPDYFDVFGSPRADTPGKMSICSRKSAKLNQAEIESRIEDQIFSRIQDDLKNLKLERCPPSGINISARLDAEGLKTSFSVTTDENEYGNNNKIDWSNSKPNDQDPLATVIAKTFETPKSIGTPPQDSLTQPSELDDDSEDSLSLSDKQNKLLQFYLYHITSNKWVQTAIILLKIGVSVAILSCIFQVRCGLNLKDIVVHNTPEYDSYLIQEKYFPIYNIFAITRGNFDYPSNQRLLYEFHKRLGQVDGVVRDERNQGETKFWLIYFRDWLLELQEKFDLDRNNSLISNEGWNQDASESAKLAYKLLVQTGKVDNPIDKSQAEINRLVDSNGIINPRGFYYYLTAWVVNDAFTYSMSGANLKPEPKVWDGNPNELKIEKARPLSYAQIPYLVKLPSNNDNLRIIQDMRSISQAFEQLSLPNFPSGIPFIFYDQYLNLDIVFMTSVLISSGLIYLYVSWISSSFVTAAIIIFPVLLTLMELYGLIGLMSIPFNNIMAVLLLATMGTSMVQTVHYATCLDFEDGNSDSRLSDSIKLKLRTVFSNLLIFLICSLLLMNSKIDFIAKYSQLMLCLAVINAINSVFFTPVMLSVIGPEHNVERNCDDSQVRETRAPRRGGQRNKKPRIGKKRHYPRVQSEISLSTISEEPQSEAHIHDVKVGLSIRCY